MLIFNHIPKAAGTSLKSLLRYEFKDRYYEGPINPSDVDAILSGRYEAIAPYHIEIVLQNWHRINKVPEFLAFWEFLIRTSTAVSTVRSPIDRFVSFVRNSNQLLNSGQSVGWYSSLLPLAHAINRRINFKQAPNELYENSPVGKLPHPSAEVIFRNYLKQIESTNGELQVPLYLSNPFRELSGQTSSLNLKQMVYTDSFNSATLQFRKLSGSSFAFDLYNMPLNERKNYVASLFFPNYNIVASHHNFQDLIRKLHSAGILPKIADQKRLNSSKEDLEVQQDWPDENLISEFHNLLPADFLLSFSIDFCGGIVDRL